MRTFPTFRCTCFVYDDRELFAGRRLLSRRRASKSRGSDGGANKFQLLSSWHCVFVSAQKPMVVVETAPHHNRLPFADLAPHYNPPLRL